MLAACGGKKSSAGEGQTDVSATETAVPKGLSEEDSIAYIENHTITSPVTAEQLLSLREVHTLDPEEHLLSLLDKRGKDALRLANRFMRMQYVAMGDPDDEMQWVKAVGVILAEYAGRYHISEAEALEEMRGSYGYLEAGTQPEINRWVYIEASVDYYKTLLAYKSFLDGIRDNPLRSLLTDEYRAWVRMNHARHEAYTYKRVNTEYYSALPMELEGMFSGCAVYRMQLLDIESDILHTGKMYVLQHPVVKTADWNEYIRQLMSIAEGTEDEEEADSDRHLVKELDKTVKNWIAARQAVARYLPEEKGTSYDNLTADYHWAITNEKGEEIPEEYI